MRENSKWEEGEVAPPTLLSSCFTMIGEVISFSRGGARETEVVVWKIKEKEKGRKEERRRTVEEGKEDGRKEEGREEQEIT